MIFDIKGVVLGIVIGEVCGVVFWTRLAWQIGCRKQPIRGGTEMHDKQWWRKRGGCVSEGGIGFKEVERWTGGGEEEGRATGEGGGR